MNYMQKQFSDVLKMPLVPEIPIFGLNLKLLSRENKNIELSKKIFQAPLNGTSACKNWFILTNIKRMSWELCNKLTSIWFEQKLIQIEEIDFEQNTVIFRILKISKKNEVFQLRVEVGKKVVTSK